MMSSWLSYDRWRRLVRRLCPEGASCDVAMPYDCSAVPRHGFLRVVDAEPPGRHGQLEMAGPRRMYLPDRLDRRRDAHGHRLTGPLGRIPRRTRPTTQAVRRCQLVDQEVPLLGQGAGELGVPVTVRLGDVGLELGQPALVRRSSSVIENQPGVTAKRRSL